MAAVRAAVNPDVPAPTKIMWCLAAFIIFIMEFMHGGESMGPDHICETQYTCYDGTVCYKHKDDGKSKCQWCGDFYTRDATTGVITYRSHVLKDDDDDSEEMNMEEPFNHIYAGQSLDPHVGNHSFRCPDDDYICQKCFDLKTREFVMWDGMDHATDVSSDSLCAYVAGFQLLFAHFHCSGACSSCLR
jgi:hypothetical protein